MRLAWLTDIHLEALDENGFAALVSEIRSSSPDTVIIGGDIGYSYTIARDLNRLAAEIPTRLCFVLGNHDYWGGAIQETRHIVSQLCADHDQLTWLSDAKALQLTPGVGLVGHDCWADARLGDYDNSELMLSDYFLISDFSEPDSDFRRRTANATPKDIRMNWPFSEEGRKKRRERMMALGDQAAAHLRKVLPEALDRYSHVFVLTHVPPFREACLHEGAIASDLALPHFSCKAAGDVLMELMKQRPERRMTVLSGHTHAEGHVRILDNLEVLTGGAEYTVPRVQRVFELE